MMIFVLLSCSVFAVMLAVALLVRVLHARGYGARLDALAETAARMQRHLERHVIAPAGSRLLAAARSCTEVRSRLGGATPREVEEMTRLEQLWREECERRNANTRADR